MDAESRFQNIGEGEGRVVQLQCRSCRLEIGSLLDGEGERDPLLLVNTLSWFSRFIAVRLSYSSSSLVTYRR